MYVEWRITLIEQIIIIFIYIYSFIIISFCLTTHIHTHTHTRTSTEHHWSHKFPSKRCCMWWSDTPFDYMPRQKTVKMSITVCAPWPAVTFNIHDCLPRCSLLWVSFYFLLLLFNITYIFVVVKAATYKTHGFRFHSIWKHVAR